MPSPPPPSSPPSSSPAFGASDGITPHLVGSLVFSALINTLFLASPIYMMQLYGRVLDSRSIETLLALSAVLALALVAMAAADAARGRLLARAGARLERRLAGPLADSLVRSDTPKTLARFTDLGLVRQFLGGSAATTLFDAPFTLLFLLVLYLLHPLLGLVATLGAVVILAAVALVHMLDRHRESAIRGGQVQTDTLARVLDGDPGDLRALGAAPGLAGRMTETLSRTGSLRRTGAERAASLGAFTRFVRMAAHSGALATGAVLTLEGKMSPAAMLAAAILAGRALGPMETLFSALRAAGTARAAMARVREQLARTPGQRGALTPGGAGAAVSVIGAMALHEGAPRAALRGVSLRIEPGEMVSVSGETGSGKTTLLRALAGIQPLKAGQILIAGQDPARLDGAALAASVGWMPQDAPLYAGTVAENIARFARVPDKAVHLAADRAGVRAAIERLPQGFETRVGTGGLDLSPGLRQQVALARALFGTPALVLLDQPTAHMDAAGEVATLNALKALKTAGITVVLVCHKPVLAAQADRMLILRDGMVDIFEDREKVVAAMRRQPVATVGMTSGRPPAADPSPETRRAAQ